MGYERQIALATRLIRKSGKTVTITRQIETDVNNALGTSTLMPDSMSVSAVVLPMSKRDDLSYRSAMSVKKLNTLMMSGEGLKFNPEPAQTVTIVGEDWTILGATPLNPNDGNPIMWDVAIRI